MLASWTLASRVLSVSLEPVHQLRASVAVYASFAMSIVNCSMHVTGLELADIRRLLMRRRNESVIKRLIAIRPSYLAASISAPSCSRTSRSIASRLFCQKMRPRRRKTCRTSRPPRACTRAAKASTSSCS